MKKIEILCDNIAYIYSIETRGTWAIPDEWDNCRAGAYGDENTKFTLTELPAVKSLDVSSDNTHKTSITVSE